MMKAIQRFIRHLLTSQWRVRRAFSAKTMRDIATAISIAEQQHDGEIRFAVEGSLEPWALVRGQTPRERAVEVFSNLGVWDTRHNSGVLIYVLLADHAVEIVADRGIYAQEGAETWSVICRQIESCFKRNAYRSGSVAGIEAVARSLCQHFPRSGTHKNELPNEPVLI